MDNLLERLIAKDNQRRVQARLRAVVVWIEVAERRAIAAAVLIIALVGNDERECRHSSAPQISPQSAGAIECSYLSKAHHRIRSLLHALEINERIVFRGIELHDVAFGQRRSQ